MSGQLNAQNDAFLRPLTPILVMLPTSYFQVHLPSPLRSVFNCIADTELHTSLLAWSFRPCGQRATLKSSSVLRAGNTVTSRKQKTERTKGSRCNG